MPTIKRTTETNIPIQIRDILKQRITDGFYPVGNRLPSVRAFLKEFGISPVTLNKTFDLLEKEGYISRTPRHGVFVIDPVREGGKPYRIAFCFPPERFVSEVIGVEEWGLASEFYRGLLDGAVKYNAEVSFLQFQNLENSSLPQVLEKLEPFDLCVFVNGELTDLSNAVSEYKRVIALRHNRLTSTDKVPLIDYNRTVAVDLMVEKMVADGIRNAGIIMYNDDNVKNHERVNYFMKSAAEKGITIQKEYVWAIDFDAPERQEQLREKFRNIKSVPEIFFADYSAHLDAVHQTGLEFGYRSGSDYKLTAICSGATMNQIPGNVWYVKIPRYAMGCGVVEIAVAARLKGDNKIELPLFVPELAFLNRE